MRVLVTGSSGRVGSRAVSHLLSRGDSVRGLDLLPSGRSATGYDEIVCTMDNEEVAIEAMADIDAVLHLGAFMSWSPADQTRMFQANVKSTRILLDAAAAASVSRFVFASSGEVYPENAPFKLPINEDDPLQPNSVYGLTKLLGEELVRYYQRTKKIQTVILRFSHTQDAAELLDESSFFSGPRFFLRPRIQQQRDFGNDEIVELLQAVDPGEPAHILARNESGRPFKMHITETRDLVQGIMLALDHADAIGETFNLGTTEPVDFQILLQKMSGITGYPVVAVDLPGPGVYYCTSNQKIRNQLGFRPQWTMDRMLVEAALARQTAQQK